MSYGLVVQWLEQWTCDSSTPPSCVTVRQLFTHVPPSLRSRAAMSYGGEGNPYDWHSNDHASSHGLSGFIYPPMSTMKGETHPDYTPL